MPALAWHAQQIADTARALHADAANGLTVDDASARLAQHGPNTIESPPTRSLLSLLAHQFRSLIVLLLIVAGTIALVMGDVSEAIAIAFVIVLNALIGFGTEWKASQALDALRDQAVPTAQVRRNGIDAEIPASDVVPGDLILLGAGDRVPADARVVESAELQVDES